MIQCKGVCSYKYSRTRPQRFAYLTHVRCKTCDIWILPEDAWVKNKARCPCCHGVLSTTPSSNKGKKKYHTKDKSMRPIYTISSGEE